MRVEIMAAGPAISVIVVTFNSESTLNQCLLSVPTNCNLVVVDQDSSDNSVELAAALRPDATVLKAGKNRGFGAGCNLGAANASGDVLIFLNPDASFLNAESVHTLASTAVTRNAVVGPRILGANGEEETRARYWSTVVSELGAVFMPVRLARGLFRHDISPDDDVYRLGGPVPYVQGSCMAISAVNFWKVGGFDEKFFLYREEEVLALALRKFGVPMMLEPLATVFHVGAVSSSQVHEFSAKQYYRSAALFLDKRLPRPLALPAVIALWAELMVMSIATPLRRLIGLRAEKDRRWYRAAARGVISGWRREVVEPPSMPKSRRRTLPPIITPG